MPGFRRPGHNYVTVCTIFIMITGSSPPQNFTVSVINSTAIHLSWLYPDLPNGKIRGYSILYAEFPDNEVVKINITLDTLNDASAQTAVVTGLVPFTQYGFRVRAFSFGDQNELPNFTHIGIATDEINVRTDEDGKVMTTNLARCLPCINLHSA